MGLAAGFLLALMGVAILQSLHPRLATLGAQDTPVHDVASAIERDAHEIVEQVEPAIETARTRFSPLESLMGAARPSRSMNMTLAADEHTIGSGDLSMHLRDHEARRVSIIGRASSGADGPAPILVSFMSADSVWLFAAPSSQDAPLKHDEDRALPELP